MSCIPLNTMITRNLARLAVCCSAAWLAPQALAQTPPAPRPAATAATPKAVAAPMPAAPQPAAPMPAAPNPQAIRVLLSPEVETLLSAQMLGRISAVNANLGGHVPRGKVLLSFDCSEPQARLRMAEAENNAARESLEVKQRLRKLDAAGDTEVLLAQAEADRTRAAIALTQVQLSQCAVKAPFSGHIVKLHVKAHQGVNVGMPLLEMVSDGPLKLRLNVPSRWLRELKVGTPFEVAIDETGKTYPAKVTAINARVDAVAQSIEMEARIDGKHPHLLAGMSGIARFPGLQ